MYHYTPLAKYTLPAPFGLLPASCEERDGLKSKSDAPPLFKCTGWPVMGREVYNPSPPSTLILSLAEQNKSQADPAVMPGMTRYAHGYNSLMNVTGVTNHFLTGFKACSTGSATHARNCKSDQKPMAQDFTAPSGNSITTILLNGYNIKLASKLIFLFLVV